MESSFLLLEYPIEFLAEFQTERKRFINKLYREVHEQAGRLKAYLQSLVLPYDTAKLECDGMTRILSYVLSKEGVDFQAFKGSVLHYPLNKDPQRLPLHYWIRVPYQAEIGEENYLVIDLRLRMWLGKSELVPHGVFKEKDYPGVIYEPNEVINLPCSKEVFELLVQ